MKIVPSAFLLLTIVIVSTSFAADPAATLLFVDDHHVLYRPGTHRVLHPAQRHPVNPVIAETNPWERAIGYCSVQYDSRTQKYQMWYQAYSPRSKDRKKRVVVCYAESRDGIQWTKPNLGLFTYDDVEDTNIVLIGNGGTSVNYSAAVLIDDRDPAPQRRYKMAYWDFVVQDGQESPGLCAAFSPDGIHWTKNEPGPLLPSSYGNRRQPPFDDERGRKHWDRPGSISDVVDLMRDPVRDKFVIYTKTWLDGPDGQMYWKRAVVRSESEDFLHWSKPELMVAPDEFEIAQQGTAASVEIHGGPTFYHAGVYLSLLQVVDFGGVGTMPAELAVSRDGMNWNRPFRGKYFLPVTGDKKKFDAGTLWTNAMPVILDDEIRFYYGAYAAWNSDAANEPTGIGLSTIRRDRFAGIRPLEKIGQVTTKPLSLSEESNLTMNADASQGSVRVELMTEDGYRLRGFTAKDAVPAIGDNLSHPVRWKEKSLKDLPSGRYVLRLHLDNAEVFAVSY